MKTEEGVQVRGDVEIVVEWLSGEKRVLERRNTILTKGREALAKAISNSFTGTYDLYVNRMNFGDAGTADGGTKTVGADRNGLFCGTPVVSKPVIAQVDQNIQTQVVFTSILTTSEANGVALSEVGLQMSNGDYYSMMTFPDLNKTSDMQITWNWRISFI